MFNQLGSLKPPPAIAAAARGTGIAAQPAVNASPRAAQALAAAQQRAAAVATQRKQQMVAGPARPRGFAAALR